MKKILLFFLLATSIFANGTNGIKTTEKENFRKIIFENQINNNLVTEEYYLKDDVLSHIVTTETSMLEKNIEKIQRKIYYFDEKQNLIKYTISEEKNIKKESIPEDVNKKAEELKKNLKVNVKNTEAKFENIGTKIDEQFNNFDKEFKKRVDKMEKDMNSFFKNF